MRNLFLLSFFTMLLITISCKEEKIDLCPNLTFEEGTFSDPDEYQIVEAIMKSEYSREEFIHIHQGQLLEVDPESVTLAMKDSEISFDSSEIEIYTIINNPPYIWGDHFSTPQNLLHKDEVTCLFSTSGSGWVEYYDDHQNSAGFLSFARPFINEQGEAFLEYSKQCGFLCGSGYIAILKKENDQWVIKQIKNTWIS